VMLVSANHSATSGSDVQHAPDSAGVTRLQRCDRAMYPVLVVAHVCSAQDWTMSHSGRRV
jgi:hypothetical protein